MIEVTAGTTKEVFSMSEIKTILAKSVEGMADGTTVYVPARSLMAAGVNLVHGTNPEKLIAVTAAELRKVAAGSVEPEQDPKG